DLNSSPSKVHNGSPFLSVVKRSSDAFSERKRPVTVSGLDGVESINDRTYDVNAQPEGIEFMEPSATDVVVLKASALVVKADPQPLLVLRDGDFKWLTRRQTFLQP